MRIVRPEVVDLDRVHIRYEHGIEELPEYVETNRASGKNFSILSRVALRTALAGSVLGKSAEVGRALQLAAEASACLFAGVSTASVRPPLGGKPLLKLERSDESLLHATAWIEAFFLNFLCRNEPGLLSLFGVPLEVLRASRTKGPACRDLFAETLQGLVAGRQDTHSVLMQALELTDPDQYDLIDEEWVLHFDVHQIHLVSRIMARDPEFESGLAEALELHKKYWSKTEERRNDPDGFLAINLLGLAALAYEKGIPFDIDCEYLPMYLVDGSFLKT